MQNGDEKETKFADDGLEFLSNSNAGEWFSTHELQNEYDHPLEILMEIEQLMYTIWYGMKSSFWCLCHWDQPTTADTPQTVCSQMC